MKKINICGKEYEINCTAFTYVKYKSFFNVEIFEDMQVIQNFILLQKVAVANIKKQNENISEEELESILGSMMMKEIGAFVTSITRIAWILIYSANEKIEEYEKWLKSIDKFSINDDWIVEVAEYTASCFRS